MELLFSTKPFSFSFEVEIEKRHHPQVDQGSSKNARRGRSTYAGLVPWT